MLKAPNTRIGAKVNQIKVETMGNKIERDIIFEMETKNATTTLIEVIMVIETIEVGPMIHLKIGMLLLGVVEMVWRELKICCKR